MQCIFLGILPHTSLLNSNVEEHPEDEDRFRRVRVSGSKFHQKVWNHECCRSFFLKSGWVEVSYLCGYYMG